MEGGGKVKQSAHRPDIVQINFFHENKANSLEAPTQAMLATSVGCCLWHAKVTRPQYGATCDTKGSWSLSTTRGTHRATTRGTHRGSHAVVLPLAQHYCEPQAAIMSPKGGSSSCQGAKARVHLQLGSTPLGLMPCMQLVNAQSYECVRFEWIGKCRRETIHGEELLLINVNHSRGFTLSSSGKGRDSIRGKTVTMSSDQKEKDVLARQKQLAAMMAARRKHSKTNAKNETNYRKRGTTASTSSSSATTKRPRIRGRLSNSVPVPTSSVIDLTESEKPSSSVNKGNKKGQVVMGIHKSFKRQSASSVMAAARAKAMKQKKPEVDGKSSGDDSKKGKDTKRSMECLKSKKPMNSNDEGNKGKTASKNRLANIVHNATVNNSGMKDDWSSTSSITPDDFWKNIRKWDFVAHLATLQLDGSKDKDHYRKVVPDTFINTRHYVSVWAPLCLDECRAQLLSDIVTECGQMRGRNSSPFVLVNVESTWKTGRNSSRDTIPGAEFFSDITDSCQVILKIPEREARNNHHNRLQFFPHDICCLVPTDKKDVVENLLFRGNGNGSGKNRFVSEDSDSDILKHACIVGHTEMHRRDVNGLILKVSKRKWAQVGSSKSGKSGSGAQMYLLKIGCNITALREFTALSCVDTLPLKHYLLGKQIDENNLAKKKGDECDNRNDHKRYKRKFANDPRLTNKDSLIKMMGGVEALGKGFTEYAIRKFNPSQLMAISASSQGYGDGGFTLIKGPPGTGKTTTLVNILNALHIRQFNKYYDEVRKIVAIQTGNRQTALEIARRAKPRLLVCAPSNAAVDNVILKIMEDGFVDGNGHRYNPSISRIGVGQSSAVKDVALETKVDQILTDNSDVQQLESSIAGFRTELQRISTDIMKCRKRIHAITNASPWPLGKDWEIRVEEENFDETGRVFFVNHKDHSTTYECPPPPEPGERQFFARSMPEYRAFMARTVKLVESYFNMKTNLEQSTIVKGSLGNGARHFEVKQNLEMHVLNSVHIVMTTLGTAGNRVLTEGVDKFEVVVVDEAAQSVEPATLAAMQLGSRHCVMVGDPQQLPATIFNVSGKNSKYDRSLFQRLEEAGEKVYMLNEQYRMHPKISHFPRHIFYKGALKDGPNVRKADYGNPLVETITSRVQAFQPFTVLDLDSKEERGGTSLSNSTEADLAVFLYNSLKEISNGLSATNRVAVITPYSQQANLLRKKFCDLLGTNYTKHVEVNTVDAFQGREAKIVIFSAVRAAGSHGIGFLSDVRRMNVALTRAKNFLFVIARCKSIIVNPYWKDLVGHARDTNAVITVPLRRKSSKKGKTQFDPVHQWRRSGDPHTQLPSTQGSSFKDQLKFFQDSSSSVGQSSSAYSPPSQSQPQSFLPIIPPTNSVNVMGPNISAPSQPPPPPPPPPPPLLQPQNYQPNSGIPCNSNNFICQNTTPPPPPPPPPPSYIQNHAPAPPPPPPPPPRQPQLQPTLPPPANFMPQYSIQNACNGPLLSTPIPPPTNAPPPPPPQPPQLQVQPHLPSAIPPPASNYMQHPPPPPPPPLQSTDPLYGTSNSLPLSNLRDPRIMVVAQENAQNNQLLRNSGNDPRQTYYP